MRLETGKNLLGIEGEVAWVRCDPIRCAVQTQSVHSFFAPAVLTLSFFTQVTPGSFTIHNYPCAENGANCVVDDAGMTTQFYVDPAHNVAAVHERLNAHEPAAATSEKLLRA